MNVLRNRLMAAGFAALALMMFGGCEVTGVGVDGSVGVVGYDAGYYEPYGYEYGGWGGGYRVGPGRGGEHLGRPAHGTHPYRAAPPSRSMPSIPSRPRGGGQAHGGGQSHGGGHH